MFLSDVQKCRVYIYNFSFYKLFFNLTMGFCCYIDLCLSGPSSLGAWATTPILSNQPHIPYSKNSTTCTYIFIYNFIYKIYFASFLLRFKF